MCSPRKMRLVFRGLRRVLGSLGEPGRGFAGGSVLALSLPNRLFGGKHTRNRTHTVKHVETPRVEHTELSIESGTWRVEHTAWSEWKSSETHAEYALTKRTCPPTLVALCRVSCAAISGENLGREYRERISGENIGRVSGESSDSTLRFKTLYALRMLAGML